jgi:hypothetical protein
LLNVKLRGGSYYLLRKVMLASAAATRPCWLALGSSRQPNGPDKTMLAGL